MDLLEPTLRNPDTAKSYAIPPCLSLLWSYRSSAVQKKIAA
jgi:hypothetical protein